MHPAHEYKNAHLSHAVTRTVSTHFRALSTEMQLQVEMPGKDSGETKVEPEVDNPVNSKPKLVSIKVTYQITFSLIEATWIISIESDLRIIRRFLF